MGVNQNDSSCCAAGAYIDSSNRGIIYGNVKSFVEEHPLDEDLRIVYASIEGPEAAAYSRGTARLMNGMAVVYFPEHFSLTASPDGMSATVTPTSVDSLGLAVTEVTPEYMVVEELSGGGGSYDFHYRVTAVRAGYEDFEVIRHRSEFELDD